jgi:hypothetical protein
MAPALASSFCMNQFGRSCVQAMPERSSASSIRRWAATIEASVGSSAVIEESFTTCETSLPRCITSSTHIC